MKKSLLLIASVLMAASLTSCGGGSNENNGPIKDQYNIVPELDYTGELDVFCYIVGQSGRFNDIGSDQEPSELFDSSLAKYHAAAKAWKEFYPNIKINVFYSDSIDGYDTYIRNYQAQFGHLPHIMHLPTTPQEGLNKGYNVDLSQYSYMSYYRAINPTLLNYFTIGGYVSAVPMYIYPTGVFVNKSILEKEYLISDDNYLDNWTYATMVEYARRTASEGSRAGMGYISNDIVNNAAKTINYTLLNEKKIDFNTPEIKEILQLENELAKYSAYDWRTNNIKEAYNSFIHTYSYNTNFINEQNYTMESSRSYCSLLYSQMIESNDEIGNFDFLPMPRLNEGGDMTIGIIAEGLVVGNQCPIGTECSEKAKLAQEAAAAFAMFMNVDTRAYTEMSKVKWTYQNEEVVGIVESLPVIDTEFRFAYNELETTDYEQQLEIYKNLRPAWKDQPGFNEIIRIYEEEPENTYAYNTIPRLIPTGGTGETKDIIEEWDRRYFGDGTVVVGDTNWPGWVEQQLETWTRSANKNIQTCYAYTQEQIDMYYGEGKYDVSTNERTFKWPHEEEIEA